MPFVDRRAAVLDDLPDEELGARVAAGEQMDDRQRHLALAQISADGLAECIFFAREIEQVVDELERHADVQAVVPERVLLLRVRPRPQHAPDTRAACKEKCGLAADDLEVLVLGEIDDPVLRQLIQLALDHAQRHLAEQANEVEAVARQRHRHRLDVEEVAEQHGDVVAPP